MAYLFEHGTQPLSPIRYFHMLMHLKILHWLMLLILELAAVGIEPITS